MDYRHEVLEQTCCYRGFFTLNRYRVRHRLYRGGWGRPIEREVLERGHAAGLIPYDPALDQVVLIEQFRPGALEAPGGPWMIEFVAGILEPGEPPEQVAARECVEEAGLEVRDLLRVAEFVLSPGGSSERLVLYCGRVDARGAGGVFGLAAEGEDIRAFALPCHQALGLLEGDRVLSATTLIGLQWLALHRERLRARWG